MAVYDENTVVLVSVFCDECEITETADYMVPAGVDSLTTARYFMSTKGNWTITKFDDICPDCMKEIETNDPEKATSLKDNVRVW